MRKVLLIAAMLLALAALTAGVVMANAGPHGGYGITTDACAGCHRAHTAPAAELLRADGVEALCQMCHLNGAGSQIDPWNSVSGLAGNGPRLNGGGFDQIGTDPVLSKHNTGDSATVTAWGGASSGQGAQGILECTSCHNPHGSTNYRILKDSDNGYPYGEANAWKHRWDYVSGMTITDTNTLSWANSQVLETNVIITGTDGSTDKYSTLNRSNMTQGINNFCATCHKSYLTSSGSAGQPSTTEGGAYFYPGTQDANDGNGDIARFRHVVSRSYNPDSPQFALRFAALGNDPALETRNGYMCLTCHFAHGTTAEATGYAANVAPTNDSALLYYPNRGVCNSCHQKGK